MTFSIVARDEHTGQLGVAVQSHWFAVGALCPWVEAGVGAVATQSVVEVGYGPKSLALMRQGRSAQEALEALITADENSALRQVAIVDNAGGLAVHSGERCVREAGYLQGGNYSVQANMMKKSGVWPAMAEAFETAWGSLAERMLSALCAAQAEGGDVRGKQSAAMLVADSIASAEPWRHQLINIRVDDHPEPLEELNRLLKIQTAYNLMNEGDEALANGLFDDASSRYSRAAELAPNLAEMLFWQAVGLTDSGHLDKAIPIFQRVFKINPEWAELLRRLPASGLIKDDSQTLEKILYDCKEALE